MMTSTRRPPPGPTRYAPPDPANAAAQADRPLRARRHGLADSWHLACPDGHAIDYNPSQLCGCVRCTGKHRGEAAKCEFQAYYIAVPGWALAWVETDAEEARHIAAEALVQPGDVMRYLRQRTPKGIHWMYAG